MVKDHENTLHEKDLLIHKLKNEMKTMKKEADAQNKTIRELKEILQTQVKRPGPAQLRHRAGECLSI